jgi:lipoate-protein ligase A
MEAYLKIRRGFTMEKRTWRLVEVEMGSFAEAQCLGINMADAIGQGKAPPTVYLATYTKNTASLGLHTNADVYIDYNYCKSRDDIVVSRGKYGYGALFFDKGSCYWMVVGRKEDFKLKELTLNELYRSVLTHMAEAVSKEYNVPVHYRPLNDLEIKQRKIGGYGGYSVGDTYNFYGFYQLKLADTATAEKVLKTPPEKVADKVTKTAAERMACIEEEAGREISWEDFKNTLKKASAEYFGIELVPGELTDYEKELFEKDWKWVSSEEFILSNSDDRRLGPMPPGAKRREGVTKVTGGPALRIVAYINPEENRIINISITGSIHSDPRPLPFWLEGALKGVRCEENAIRAKVEEIFSIGQVGAATPADFVKAIMVAVAG